MKKGPRTDLGELVEEMGLDSFLCKCGHRTSNTDLFRKLFAIILERCKRGEIVRIKGFGNFMAIKSKKRMFQSPLFGKVEIGSLLSLKFKQSKKCKETLNLED